MKTLIFWIELVAVLAALAWVAAGCNTVGGLGRDLQALSRYNAASDANQGR